MKINCLTKASFGTGSNTIGSVIRARARWHEYGEKSSKYFLNLEKRDHVKKHTRKLLKSGSITTDRHIGYSLNKTDFNKTHAYKTNDSVEALDFIEAFLNSLNIPKLSEKQRQSFERRITTEECRTIIKKRSITINHQGMMVSPFNFYTKAEGISLVNHS